MAKKVAIFNSAGLRLSSWVSADELGKAEILCPDDSWAGVEHRWYDEDDPGEPQRSQFFHTLKRGDTYTCFVS
jgi:hypothetical protein